MVDVGDLTVVEAAHDTLQLPILRAPVLEQRIRHLDAVLLRVGSVARVESLGLGERLVRVVEVQEQEVPPPRVLIEPVERLRQIVGPSHVHPRHVERDVEALLVAAVVQRRLVGDAVRRPAVVAEQLGERVVALRDAVTRRRAEDAVARRHDAGEDRSERRAGPVGVARHLVKADPVSRERVERRGGLQFVAVARQSIRPQRVDRDQDDVLRAGPGRRDVHDRVTPHRVRRASLSRGPEDQLHLLPREGGEVDADVLPAPLAISGGDVTGPQRDLGPIAIPREHLEPGSVAGRGLTREGHREVQGGRRGDIEQERHVGRRRRVERVTVREVAVLRGVPAFGGAARRELPVLGHAQRLVGPRRVGPGLHQGDLLQRRRREPFDPEIIEPGIHGRRGHAVLVARRARSHDQGRGPGGGQEQR